MSEAGFLPGVSESECKDPVHCVKCGDSNDTRGDALQCCERSSVLSRQLRPF